MTIACNLNSLNNLRLLSYFSPDKFDMKMLQKANFYSDLHAAFLTYLLKDIHTYNLSFERGIVYLELINSEDYDYVNNFATLEFLDLNELFIDTNSILSFKTDDELEYTDCRIIDMKLDNTSKMKLIVCEFNYGSNDYIFYDVRNNKICFVGKDEKSVYNRLYEKF